MRIVMFYHSLLSDWNHGNAHFLRGVASDLIARGVDVDIYEPRDSWSLNNLVSEYGTGPIDEFHNAYPTLSSIQYDAEKLDLDSALKGADLVIVHEWNRHDLVREIGKHRASNGSYKLLFHDTHHRSVTDRKGIEDYDLSHYDGILAFGDIIRRFYSDTLKMPVWTWHEAADVRQFHPIDGVQKKGDLVWIGNWGDDERTEELNEFLIEPVKDLGLKAKVFGVRYPKQALDTLARAGIEYGGWLPNYKVPQVFAEYRVTVHVPRRPYTEQLPGIPTIRPFEALACGIPLISAPWSDSEHLFRDGRDLLFASDGDEMKQQLRRVLSDPQLSRSLAQSGLETIRARHTCSHRVDELMNIYDELVHENHDLAATV